MLKKEKLTDFHLESLTSTDEDFFLFAKRKWFRLASGKERERERERDIERQRERQRDEEREKERERGKRKKTQVFPMVSYNDWKE